MKFDDLVNQPVLIIVFFAMSLSIFIDESFGAIEDSVDEHPLPILTDPNFKIQLVQANLNFPTKMTFIDDNIILVGQKNDGKIIVIKNFQLQKQPAFDLAVESGWERGLSGLTSVNFQGKDYVFVYFTKSNTDLDTHVPTSREGTENNGNALFRFIWNGTSLVDPIQILHPIPYSQPWHHGGAMTILDETLFLTVGDNFEEGFLVNSSDETIYDRGVIFRIDFTGEPISTNPFREESISKYFAYGIRNSYGITVDPKTNYVWDTENGEDDFDEVNLVFPGFNSGWNKIMGPIGKGKFSSEIDKLTNLEGSKYSDPKFSWKFPVAPTAIEFLKSSKYGEDLQNDVFIGDVHGRIYHLELNENRDGFVFSDQSLNDLIVNSPEEMESLIFGKNLGIVTDIKTGPDGYLYIVSMVHADAPGWGIWASQVKNLDWEKKGALMGVIFRIIPSSHIVEEILEISPPRHQIAKGILPYDVRCIEGLKLIFKSINGNPTCVKDSTAEKLFERGWGYN